MISMFGKKLNVRIECCNQLKNHILSYYPSSAKFDIYNVVL